MSKRLIYTAVAIISFLLLMVFLLPRTNTVTPVHKKYMTGFDMKQESIEKKKARRASGWAKPDKPSEFDAFQNAIRTKAGALKPDYPLNYKLNELGKSIQKRSQLKSASVKLNWIERGPGNVSGRTRGLIVDPDDPKGDTWFAGSVGGGIWKTSDAGKNWTNLTPDLPNLATVCLTMPKSNTKVIYAGTGEGFSNLDAIGGDGIFKSIDKGISWKQLPTTANNADFSDVNRILVNPNNENEVWAATNSALFKSKDGGVTWVKKFSGGGRIQQIIADPTDFSILYASVNSNGVIKSTNSGDDWSYCFSNTVGRIEMAIAPSLHSTIYAINENSELFVSTNSGTNWAPTTKTSGSNDLFLGNQGWYDNTLAVTPDNSKKLMIGGINLYYALVTGGGSTTVNVVNVVEDGTKSFMDFVNFGGDYLGGGIKIDIQSAYLTSCEIRFGKNISQKAHRFLVPAGSTSGVADQNYSYADYVEVPFQVWDTDNNKQIMVSFRDQDRNGIFNLTTNDDNLLQGREYIFLNNVPYSQNPNSNISKNGGHTYHQIAFCWPLLADNAVWDPANLPTSKITISSTKMKVQNISSTKLSDWAGSGKPYVHADLHNIQFVNTSSGITRIIVCNDGGMGYSEDNGVTWINPTNGYNSTQFYGVDKHPTENRYIGGMQDNGTWFSPKDPDYLTIWTKATEGDGFDVVWHPVDPTKLIATVYKNSLNVSYDSGNSWASISGNLTDVGDSLAPFITQIGYSPSDPDKLFVVGKSGVSWSEDFGKHWAIASMQDGWNWWGSGFVEPSICNPQIVWAASNMSSNGHIMLSTDGGKSFSATSNYPETMGTLSGLATHPNDPNTAYALFSFAKTAKILRTTDSGKTWNDITGFAGETSNNGFPDVAVYSLMVMPQKPSEIWVGTEIGLFISEDNGKTWNYANNGLPSVSIWEMKIRGTQVLVATHGRGIWTVDIPEINSAEKGPVLIDAGMAPNGKVAFQLNLTSLYDSTQIVIDGKRLLIIPTNNVKTENQILEIQQILSDGSHTAQLIGFKSGNGYYSGNKQFTVIGINKPVLTYVTNFDNGNTDFYGPDFTIEGNSTLGSGMAVNSKHPYEENKDVHYLLKTPVIINKASDNTSRFYYRDIPMVEEGEAGSTFPSLDFYDYVVAEATLDGINWTPLLDGYDFSSVKMAANLAGKTINDQPVEKMFLYHELDLSKFYNQGDTILIRFTLHSDMYSVGWGWVFDNVEIQNVGLAVKELKNNSTISLYPNPCNQILNVELNYSGSGYAGGTIFDINGKIAGQYELNRNGKTVLNISDLPVGFYILEIKTGSRNERMKFLIRR
jgi:photosystem II stability/assembly factor-like uncharacterized protein